MFTRAWERCISPAITQAGSASQVVTISLRAHEEQPEHGVDVTSESIDALMTAATQVITHAFIAAQTGRLLMLHAGAVAHPVTNRALVYVAAGGTGKTTFTRLLGTHYRYLTDETVAVDEQHRVLPYPKPLSIRVPGSRYKAETPPDDLGILPANGPAPVVKILLLDRSDSYQTEPEVEAADLFDALIALAPQTSALSKLDAGLHQLAGLIGTTGGVLRVQYREAESLLPLVADLIGDPE